MPDGDKVHARLAHRWQKVYQQTCEGYLTEEELSYELARPLTKEVRRYGHAPIQIVEQVAARLEQIPAGPLFRELDQWNEMRQEIDRVAQQNAYSCNRRGIDLAVKACKEQLDELRNSNHSDELCQRIMNKYILNVYIANYEERIPLAKQHYNDASQATVDERLQCVRPYIEQRIAALSEQVIQKGNVKSLKPPSPQQNKQSIGLHDNLLPN